MDANVVPFITKAHSEYRWIGSQSSAIFVHWGLSGRVSFWGGLGCVRGRWPTRRRSGLNRQDMRFTAPTGTAAAATGAIDEADTCNHPLRTCRTDGSRHD